MIIPHHELPNTTSIEFTDPWSIYEDRQAGIFAWAILGIIFLFFLGLIIYDMFTKYLTGELREEWTSCVEMVVLLIRLPCMIFSKNNMRALWIMCTNVLRKKGNKRGVQKSNVELRDRFDSAAVIERLGGGSNSSQSSENSKEAKGKAKEITQLPNVAEHPASKAAPLGRGIAPFEGLPVVFEVPEILSETSKQDGSFTSTPVHGLGIRSNNQSPLNSNIDLELGRGDRLTSVGNGRGSFAQDDGDSSPAGHDHSHGSNSGSGSGSHNHSVHFESGSVSHGHSYFGGSHDFGGSFDAGGSCDAGGGGGD